jgi:hypothetical protein
MFVHPIFYVLVVCLVVNVDPVFDIALARPIIQWR